MEMMAIEVTGTIDKDNKLRLNELLPIVGPKPVRVIILSPADDDWNEGEPDLQNRLPDLENLEWSKLSLTMAMRGMEDEEEPVYTIADLKEPF